MHDLSLELRLAAKVILPTLSSMPSCLADWLFVLTPGEEARPLGVCGTGSGGGVFSPSLSAAQCLIGEEIRGKSMGRRGSV